MSCSRTWEVEAARDGRLGEQERKAHARHVAECSDCRREQRALDELQVGLRAVAGSEVSDGKLRHGRQALLERALAERNERGRARHGYRRPLAVALAAAALALVVWWGFGGAASSAIVVRAARGASYRRYEEGGRQIIDLERGRLEIEVGHAEGEPRLRVRTPDGVVDDVGTTFVVEVAAGRTELVEVSVGLVRVALVGRPVAMVEPGLRYRPYKSADVTASTADAGSVTSTGLHLDAPSEPIAQPEPIAQRQTPMPPRATRDSSRFRGPKGPRKPPQTSVTERPRTTASDSDAGDDGSPSGRAFAEAVQTLDRGEAVEAARRFRAFAQTYPTDRRAEDAGYLRVVAWLRAGKRAEARSAAEEFLRRYPAGFRRQDVERLLLH